MIDITHKIRTHRMAIARALVKVSRQETIDAIQNKTVPKGDVLEASRVAGLFGIKKTSEMIPDCHPLPIEFAVIRHKIEGLTITVETEVHTIYRTGVEVEAMHGASVTALTIYDMLKPIDKSVEIASIKLLEKKGGKTEFSVPLNRTLKAAVIVCSDRVAAGLKEDTAGKSVIRKLEQMKIAVNEYEVIPDEIPGIQEKIMAYHKAKIDLIVLTGGTGLTERDVTPEAVRPLLDREIPGIAEAARNYGQELMPYAMLSRSVGGLMGNTLVLALPGSPRGAEESMDALFPQVLHYFKLIENPSHE